ncbi:two pore calcium channel protein 1 [Vigna radiata var. radiata]|uniref:Two pore calcium channel protein 1 n=1 Tax=Vigna radiata var. radiata TaxID=3916 RepID=A0A1S3UWV9_VIGRR|nr:two pore calcium channel protein 1 [Vigna radiata var. radiata]XP_014510526.1 two pore calcium channel protein 1 [Vigna radiata var. radiata]XP_014510535.1 two pore calcium channel protein 1 [Vigna radiata var. radiata]XP_014510543.1 two pore calcium channel protein 1 [Vigna radiata var. radiata]
MDQSLLRGESSGFGSRRRGLFRRSDAITYGSNYEKAAALIDLAEDGVGLPEQILDSSNFQNYARFYFIFIKFNLIWSLSYFALIVLNFLEKPLWCKKLATHSCNDREYFYLGQLPYLTDAECLIYEAIALLVLIIHTFFPLWYEGSRIYWKSTFNQLKVFCLLVLVVDTLLYAFYLSPLAFDFLPFRIAPYIRVVLFVLNIRELRETITILFGMLDTYLNVLALGLLFLLFASWVAYVFFEDTIQGKTVFTSYGATLYQMFLLFTTSNNPDVWVPAYKSSRWYCLFFVLFVLVGVYFVTNLILAVVYDSFKSELVKQVFEKDLLRRTMLDKAFNLLDTLNIGALNKNQCIRLFEELNKYRTLPKISSEEFELIFDELDDSHDIKINKDEFADICNAIALKFQKEDVMSYFEYLAFYDWPSSKTLKEFVKSAMFGYIVSFILIVNLVAVIIETTLDIENNSGQKVWQVVEFIFGWIYVVEMLLKVYAYGFENYWRDGQNRFDFVITVIIVIGETVTFAVPDDALPFIANGEWIRYLLLARMLRLIRLLMHVKRYRAFVATFLTLIPSLMPYLGIIFCVLCIYCSLGVQIFGGIVNAGNPELESTALAENDYLVFNFNDYPNGIVTLFNFLVTATWDEVMTSYTELTGTSWTYLYFISFYLVTVLLLLNLVIAFVLEAFFAEMDLESSESSEGTDKDVEGDKYRKRSIGTKTRSQRVDTLLHHMLSAELCQNQPSNTATS